ncbi:MULTISPECIES: glycine--tRNA ligase subunit beta [Mesobacillus]|uniref:Glycine--tRNA ligase beta subunit n=1 Tax=Mesobacillus selenatarsenatis TaxID=388741 RepID=A0A846TTK7_9BACI|nr:MULTISPECIES: glycine--tRNA ligase subunit beta [Mesobacillus]NKE05136.1 glycine--tRNA ligase subunit beta [Mesobacillus selenatarsenatis]
MTKRDLLLEIGLEEMPARFITDSINQLASKVEKWLNTNNIGFEEIKLYSTPRRLALLVLNVDERQEDSEEEAKGPAKKIAMAEGGEWSKAAIGFTRGQGLSVEDIYFKEINGVEYAHVKKFIKGKETFELLVELKAIISGLTFPKNMRWADRELRYVRPIKWLVAMFGNEIIPFEIAGAETGSTTRGHRFLGEGEIVLSNPQEYEEALLGQYVVADAQKRKEAIISQLEKIEEENGWAVPVDEDLLEEVNNLVEYPTALYGRFEDEFLEIPSEVLITSMKEHQRYFPVKSKSGDLLPHFITVRNGDHLHIEKVARGNEKVLRARLADAAFFYKEDQRMQIDAALDKLKNVVYHEEIGTIAEKSERVRKLVGLIADRMEFSPEILKNADRAAQISKFDLVSQMVYEFPELQGIMGEKYALQKGENPEVAAAINEHYMPRNAEDSIPGSPSGALVAISDKMDTIVAFFSLGIIPSGSQDPYALRRQATGIVQTLIEKKWDITLENLVGLSLNLVTEAGIIKRNDEEVYHDLIQFFKLRVKHLLQERGIRYDLIDAVLGGEIGMVSELIEKADTLQDASRNEGFKESIEALSRVLNIASKKDVLGDIDPERFESEYEQKLYEKYLDLGKKAEEGMDAASYYQLLVDIKPTINDYFEHTMVMADQAELRENRLNQMAALAVLIMKLAKVNDIVVK